MLAFAEVRIGNDVTITTTTRTILSVSYEQENPNIIIREDNISYFSTILDSGYIIQDEPALTYGIYV
jgi:hypothetical protein